MESTQIIERLASGAMNPFSFEGSLWVVWFLIGIATLWLDLSKRVHLGLLSIAAFVAVFTSFALPVSSQGKSLRNPQRQAPWII